MPRVIRIVALTCSLAVIVPGSGRGAEQQTTEEAAVRAAVTTYLTARDQADAAALSALFTDDADQLVSSGEWRRGRAELVRGTLASSKSNAGARTITIQTVRLVTPDVAIADGEYVIAAGSSAAARKMWTSFVMVRSGGRWRISAVRNMLPAPPAQ